tara:strand:- start:497 stop:715 length:219 start_codon:yes stop_codon:yes gene_type:complete
MNELNEKYLARMLEGAEQGLDQVEMAIKQIKDQLEQMEEQKVEMITAVREIKELLGLESEESKPELLVEDEA